MQLHCSSCFHFEHAENIRNKALSEIILPLKCLKSDYTPTKFLMHFLISYFLSSNILENCNGLIALTDLDFDAESPKYILIVN